MALERALVGPCLLALFDHVCLSRAGEEWGASGASFVLLSCHSPHSQYTPTRAPPPSHCGQNMHQHFTPPNYTKARRHNVLLMHKLEFSLQLPPHCSPCPRAMRAAIVPMGKCPANVSLVDKIRINLSKIHMFSFQSCCHGTNVNTLYSKTLLIRIL